MAKIILNGCFGGYGWSKKGILAVLQKKNFKNLKFFATVYPTPGNRKTIQISEQEFLQFEEHRRTSTGCYIGSVYIEDETGKEWSDFDINREDPDAIAVLEERGAKFCSGDYSDLYIEDYDENLFVASIDEYDGVETLRLSPNLSEESIRACKNIDEIVELLKATGAI